MACRYNGIILTSETFLDTAFLFLILRHLFRRSHFDYFQPLLISFLRLLQSKAQHSVPDFPIFVERKSFVFIKCCHAKIALIDFSGLFVIN